MDESSAYPPDLYAFADLGAGWYDRFKHLAWRVDQEWLQFSAECQEYPVTNDCAIGQPIRTEAEGLAALYRQIRQVGLAFAAADTPYHDPLAPTRPFGDTLTLPVVAMSPLGLSQLPADDGTAWGQRLMETAGIVPDPMLPKAQWLMHNAAGWDWFLGFSYVSLSYIRDLDYLVASVLFPGFGVALQAARTGAAWGSALRDDTGYENALIQTALLSLGAFGLYLAKLPPGSTLGPASQLTSSGELVMSPAAVNLDVAGRALVIASQIGQVLFSTPDGPSGLRHIYNRRTDSPNWPDDFIQHEKIEVNVKNQVLLEKLRNIESGKWVKVYENGTLGDGTRVSMHYFRSSSGKVFDVELHFGWSSR